MLHYAYHLLLELLPVFLLAVIASSLIDYYLPDSYIHRLSSIKNKNLGIYFSAIVGSLIPLCTCGMIPLTLKLHKKGLAWPYLCAFLVSGNACSITALILTSSISFELAVIRFFASVVFGVFVANLLLLFSKAVKDFELKLLLEEKTCCDHEHKESLWHKLSHDLIEISYSFLPWILLAASIAAVMHNFLAFDSTVLLRDDVFSPLLASVIAFPFYFCAGADVPISAELIKQSVSIGTLISFMLASPGVNITSLFIYSKAVGMQKAILLLVTSILVSSILGLIINISL